MGGDYKVVPFPMGTCWDERWCVVDAETGEVLDDAQGYGFKTAKKAHAAWRYKTRSDPERILIAQKKEVVRDWCKEHPQIVSRLEDEAFYALKVGQRFGAKEIREFLNGIELPCPAADFARYWGGV